SLNIEKCDVSFIESFETKEFFFEYDLYDFKDADIFIGVKDSNGELIAVGSYLEESNQEYSLMQFSTVNEFSGCSEVLSLVQNFFEETFNPKSTIFIMDLSYSWENVLESCNWVLDEANEPCFSYISKRKRVMFSLESTNEKIWDCGSLVFRKVNRCRYSISKLTEPRIQSPKKNRTVIKGENDLESFNIELAIDLINSLRYCRNKIINDVFDGT